MVCPVEYGPSHLLASKTSNLAPDKTLPTPPQGAPPKLPLFGFINQVASWPDSNVEEFPKRADLGEARFKI